MLNIILQPKPIFQRTTSRNDQKDVQASTLLSALVILSLTPPAVSL